MVRVKPSESACLGILFMRKLECCNNISVGIHCQYRFYVVICHCNLWHLSVHPLETFLAMDFLNKITPEQYLQTCTHTSTSETSKNSHVLCLQVSILYFLECSLEAWMFSDMQMQHVWECSSGYATKWGSKLVHVHFRVLLLCMLEWGNASTHWMLFFSSILILTCPGLLYTCNWLLFHNLACSKKCTLCMIYFAVHVFGENSVPEQNIIKWWRWIYFIDRRHSMKCSTHKVLWSV